MRPVPTAYPRALSALLTLLLLACIASPGEANPAAGASTTCLDPDHLHDTPGGEPSKGEDEQEDDDEGLPLKPERTLDLHVTSGTWMSLDLSPDGKTLVFDLLGDLYTLPFSGGKATRISEGLAFDAQPRFSPDGGRIAFTSDRSGADNIWVMELGTESEPTQVSKTKKHEYQSPEWTPDGDYIIASRGGIRAPPSKPWLFHVDGGSGMQLVEEPDDIKLLGAAFGNDSRHVWFAKRTGRWNYNAQFPQYQLVVFDRDKGELHAETSRYGSAFRPTLSPDGKWLVYGTRHDEHTGLRIRELETGAEKWLAYPVQHDEQEARAARDVLPGMSFTPDSNEVVATADGRIWRFPLDGSQPIEIPFEVEEQVDLGPKLDFEFKVDDAPTFQVRQIRDAVPSPDGGRLAFVAMDRLWLMDLPDGKPRRVTRQEEHAEHQPAWSPDGRSLAFVSWAAEGGGRVHVVRARPGSRARHVSGTAYYLQPAWSPDGKRIALLRGDARILQESDGPAWGAAGLMDLVWVSPRGGEEHFIAHSGGRQAPHFVTDQPERIWLHHHEKGLLSIRWDGTDERAHVKVTGHTDGRAKKPSPADLILVSPDGGQVLAQTNTDLFVAALPRTAKPASISIVDPKSTIVPARKLTTVGGQFPSWSADGSGVHWSVGSSHFRYDLEAARIAEEKAEAEAKAKEEAEKEKAEKADEEADSDEDDEEEKKKPAYLAESIQVPLEVKRDIPRGDVVLRGGRVITMVGNRILEGADILIHDNRIVSVTERGELSIPEGADVVDVSGTTITPGFVDTHAHVWSTFDVHRGQVWQYLANLAYGVTTTRDPQTATTDVLSYFDQIESGAMLGPRLYSTGPGIFWSEEVKDEEHARHVVERYAKYYGVTSIKMYLAGNREQRQWILQACKELGIRPTTEGALDLKLNLSQILDGYPGHEHNFPNLDIQEDVVHLVQETETLYTPTLLVTYGGPAAENWFFPREDVHADAKVRHFMPHSHVDSRGLQRQWFHPIRHKFDDHAIFVRELVEAGGLAGVGSHGQFQGLGYHWELWAMASAGMSPLDALRCATILGAEGLGYSTDLGSIEAGKIADLVILDENPLEDIRNTNSLRYVMKNGRLHDADTLDEIWPRSKPLDRRHWWAEEPVAWQP